MSEYHKIHSVYKRDPSGKKMLFGEYSLDEFAYLKDCQWEFTEKVDGTNIRVIIENGDVRFGGKTDNAQLPVKLLARLQERFLASPNKERLLENFVEGAILYGEGYGAGIQKVGGLYGKDQDFVLFDVRIGPWWLQRKDVDEIAANLGVPSVPVIGSGTLADMEALVQAKPSSTWGTFESEGVVARPVIELKNRAGQRVITKLKCRDFAC